MEEEKTIAPEPEEKILSDDPAEDIQVGEDTVAGDTEVNGEQPVEPADDAQESPAEQKPKKGFRAWWDKHGLSRRRLIQIYAALLYNANIKGFISGDIFTGLSKTACVPGLNCYSCPGAVGACPLGALQNALAGTKARAPYFMLAIILLYGLILGRTICGWLCPVGLSQDLLYKIKTPKIKKGKITRILSYLKYVLLIVLVVAIPLIYGNRSVAVPGFCKYVCPAGTFGGAILLLVNPANEYMFGMLGALFTWKAVVLFAVVALCIFCYRAFCRFLCPLGAIYGLFNKIALLGIKVEKSKCIDCGKCVGKCKMDIKKVGDHECINCGECIDVCPTKAIVWKGGKVFMRNIDEKEMPVAQPTEIKGEAVAAVEPDAPPVTQQKPVRKRGRAFWMRAVAYAMAGILFVGVAVYANFFSGETAAESAVTYELEIGYGDDRITDTLVLNIGSGSKEVKTYGGTGSADDPLKLKAVSGKYILPMGTPGKKYYFRFTASKKAEYKITTDAQLLSLKLSYVIAGKRYAAYDYAIDGDTMKITLEMPSGYGNGEGDICYDFTLNKNDGSGSVTLSELRGSIVIVNFWATWCGPCVAELPHFERVRSENGGVEVLAVHSSNITEGEKDNHTPEQVWKYITDSSRGWDKWGICFIQDTGPKDKSTVYTLLGGRNGMYPRTVVIDGEGVIRKIFPSSASYEELTAVVRSIKSGK